MLTGTYFRKIDAKRRLFIPAEIRISVNWTATHGMEGCLFLYPEKEWEKISEKLSGLSFTKKKTRAFMRIFLSDARILNCDSQGRILLPDELTAGIFEDNEVAIIGQLDHIEIWDSRKWAEYKKNMSATYEEIAEEIDLDI